MKYPAFQLQVDPHVCRTLQRLSVGICALVIGIGLLVLLGWQYDLETLKRFVRVSVAMSPVSALGFLASGLALALQSPRFLTPARLRLARVLSLLVTGLGILKLGDYLFGWQLLFDQVLFRHKLQEAGWNTLNQMAPNTAGCFLLTGLALLLIDVEFSHKRRPAELLCAIIMLLAQLSLYGYVYGIQALYELADYIPMAVPTALCFFSLSLAILFSRPDRGSIGIIINDNYGQALLFLGAAMVLPLIVGWLILEGQHRGIYGKELGVVLLTILTYVLGLYFNWRMSLLQFRRRREQEMAAHIIKEQAKELQSIIDYSPSPIALKNLQGRYTRINKQFEQIYGVAAGTIMGKTDFEVFPEQIAEQTYKHDTQSLKLGRAIHVEEEFEAEDKLRTFITAHFPLFSVEGKLHAICSISTDITERKRLEEQLRESEQQLRAILESMGEGVVVADKEGRFTMFNPVAEMLLGMGAVAGPPEQWSAQYGMFRPGTSEVFPLEETPLYRAMKGEAASEVEIFIRNEFVPEGRYISVTGRPIYDAEGAVMAGVVVFRDVSEQRALERLLMENDKKLQAVIKSIGEGIVVLDKRGKFLLFNPKAQELLGQGPAVGVSLKQLPAHYFLYHPDGVTPFTFEDLPLYRAFRGEVTEEVDLVIRHPSFPEPRHIRASARPIKDEYGKVAATLSDFRDISEFKRLEEALHDFKVRYRQIIKRQADAS